MPSNVNKKFVLIAGVVVVTGVVGVGFVGLRMMNAGGEQNISRGDTYLKAGETRKAILEYGKAVNKDRGNAQWIRTWLGAIEKYTPTTRQQYEDIYRSEYTSALRALCDADRNSPEPFKRVLDERFQTIQRQPSLANWEQMVREHDELMKLYRGDQKGKDLLGRYRGMARAGMSVVNTDLEQRLVDEGLKDLRAALAADPGDTESMVGLVTMLRSAAQRAEKTGRDADRVKLLADAKEAIATFAQQHPDSQRMKFIVLTDEMSETLKQAKQGSTYLDVFKASEAKLNDLVNTITTSPPDKADTLVALKIAPWVAVAVTDGRAKADQMLAHVRQARGKDPSFLLNCATYRMQFQQYDDAIELAKAVSALPDLPMSLDGVLLFTYRAEGVRVQADASFARWEAEKDTAKKEEWVKTIRALRQDLASRVSETAPQVLAIDGRLDLISGNITAARQTISRYNDLVQRSDPAMLAIEADILDRLNQRGAAKDVYKRILEIDPQNIRVLVSLGRIEADQKDYVAAAGHLGMASDMMPANTELRQMAANARSLATGKYDDKVLQCLRDANEKASGLTGDPQAAITLLRDCLQQHPGDIRLSLQLASLLVGTKDVAGARKVLDDSVAANPDNKLLKDYRAKLDADPLMIALDAVAKSPLSEAQKHVGRWGAYMRYGKLDEAKQALAEAVKLAPDDAAVLDAQFEDALFRKDQASLDLVVGRAQALNLDRVGGLMYKSRSLLAAGKAQESIGTLREIVSKDKLNLLAWRMLGVALLEVGKYAEAVDALSKAIEIKPDDVPSINAYLRCKVALDQFAEALAFARKSEPVAANDPDFVEMLLTLEANATGGDRMKAIDARRNIMTRAPGNRTNREKLASLLINAGKAEDALPIVDKLVAEDPTSLTAAELRAGYLARKAPSDVAGAVAYLKGFIEKLPADKRGDEAYINISRLLMQLGQPAEAKAMLESGRQYQDPKKMLIDREMGDSLFNQKQYADAATAYQHVVDSKSEDTTFAVRKRLLECYLKLKDFQKFDQVVAALPASAQSDTTILLLQAEAGSAQADRSKAQKFYDQAVAADPKSPIGFIKRGQYKLEMFAQGDVAMIKDAEADFAQAIKVDPNNIAARVLIANVYKQTGRDDVAINALKDAIGIDPYNEALRLRFVGACEEVGRINDAATACDDALKSFPNSLPWKVKAGQMWGRAGNWARATTYFKGAWGDRHAPEIGVALVESLVNSNDILSAGNALAAMATIKDFDLEKILALRMLRARVNAKNGLGNIAAKEIADSLPLVRQDSYEDATIFMSGIAGIYPKRTDQIAALTRLESGHPFSGFLALKFNELRAREPETKAVGMSALETLANNEKEDNRVRAGSWSLLGTLAYADSNWAMARDYFQRGIALDENNIELNNNLAYVLAEKLGKGAEALKYADKAAKAAPQNSGFLDTLGICQLAAQDYSKAAITLNSALQTAVNDTERIPVYIHLGTLRVKQGDKIEAKRVASRARELMSNLPAAQEQYAADLKELDKAIDGK